MRLKLSFILFVLVLFSFETKAQMSVFEQSVYLDSVLNSLLISQNSRNDELLLAVLDKQIDVKNAVNDRLKFQIIQIDKDIYNNQIYLERLNTQLDYEKNIYADLVVKAARIKSLMRQNFDIFSFDNLYKTYRQFLYVKWMSDYRIKKIKRISELQSQISKIVITLNNSNLKRADLAKRMGVEQSFIDRYSHNRINIIDNFKTSKNIQSQRQGSLSVTDTTFSKAVYLPDSLNVLTTLFQIQKGYLIWPVKKSVIVSSFGYHKHPVYDKVVIRNDGVDFCVPNHSNVKVVYNGIVTTISLLPGKKYAVVVKHGIYFTVYSGLDHIKVSRAEEVDKESVLGSFDSDSKYSVLNFQIWVGRDKINPVDWLVKYPVN